jgi:hypothetical protein
MAIVFCILLVIVGSWFLLNVILAVIMEAFDDVDQNQKKVDQRTRKELKEQKKQFNIKDSMESDDDEHNHSCKNTDGQEKPQGNADEKEAVIGDLQDTPQ